MADGPVLVVGGGVVGLSCAWFLRASGLAVTVLECGEPGGGASRGNAGAICPSMVEPLPAPGMVGHALANMRKADAALYVHPTYAPKMAAFLARFTKAATRSEYERGLAAIAQLGRLVTSAYDELAAAGIGTHAGRDGYVMAYRELAAAREEHEQLRRMASLGLCAEPEAVADGAAVRELEPLLSEAIRAGYLLPGERWVDPSRLVDDLAAALLAAGVELVEGAAVGSVEEDVDGVVAITERGSFVGATAVIAAGVWSKELCAGLGTKLLLLPGKGYSFAVRPAVLPRRLISFADAHVMGSPMGDRFRVAGTMEFDGTTDRFNPKRVEAIVRGLAPLLRDVDMDARTEEWVGPRPMTPDGLPYIGALPGHPRVVVAAGHNMLGVTLAAATGRVVAGLVSAGDPGIDLAPFSPARFGRAS